MNAFDQLARRLKTRLGADFIVSVDEPRMGDGRHFLTIEAGDGYVVEIEWQRHRGFGLVAGRELAFGSGIDEVYGSADAVLERIDRLLASRESTSHSPLGLPALRKSRGLLQKQVAERLGISKSGLAQMERQASLTSMRVDTLQKLVASMGGELVLTAHFPDGRERTIAID